MTKSIAVPEAQSPIDKQKEKLSQALQYRATHEAEAKKLVEAHTAKQEELKAIEKKHGEEVLNVDRANQVISTLAGILQDFGVDLSQPLVPDVVKETPDTSSDDEDGEVAVAPTPKAKG
jgi:hypothetical protein